MQSRLEVDVFVGAAVDGEFVVAIQNMVVGAGGLHPLRSRWCSDNTWALGCAGGPRLLGL